MNKRTIQKRKRVWGNRRPAPVDLDWILRGAAPQAHATDRKIPIKLTPYAERLLARSNGSGPGTACSGGPAEWITTRAAATLTGFSQRSIQALCASGFFVECKEWRQRPRCPGSRQGGWIWIRRSALKKLEGE